MTAIARERGQGFHLMKVWEKKQRTEDIRQTTRDLRSKSANARRDGHYVKAAGLYATSKLNGLYAKASAFDTFTVELGTLIRHPLAVRESFLPQTTHETLEMKYPKGMRRIAEVQGKIEDTPAIGYRLLAYGILAAGIIGLGAYSLATAPVVYSI